MISAYKTEDKPFSKDYSEWTRKWWQSYAYTAWRRNMGPVFMVPGKLEESRQERDIHQREFKIPRQKAILVSVINYVRGRRNKEDEKACMDDSCWKVDIVDAEKMTMFVDGQDAKDQICRVNSKGFFSLYGRESISDGYWLFLKPNALAVGEHFITSNASCHSGELCVQMQYSISIL